MDPGDGALDQRSRIDKLNRDVVDLLTCGTDGIPERLRRRKPTHRQIISGRSCSATTCTSTATGQLNPSRNSTSRPFSCRRGATWTEPKLTSYARLPSYMWRRVPVQDSDDCQQVVQRQVEVFPISCLLDPHFKAPTDGHLTSTEIARSCRGSASARKGEDDMTSLSNCSSATSTPSQSPTLSEKSEQTSPRAVSPSAPEKLPPLSTSSSATADDSASKESNRFPSRQASHVSTDSTDKTVTGLPDEPRPRYVSPGETETSSGPARASSQSSSNARSGASTTTSRQCSRDENGAKVKRKLRFADEVESSSAELTGSNVSLATEAQRQAEEDLRKFETYSTWLQDTKQVVQHPKTLRWVQPDVLEKEARVRRQHFTKRCVFPVATCQWVQPLSYRVHSASTSDPTQSGKLNTEQQEIYDRLVQLKYKEWYDKKTKILAKKSERKFKKKKTLGERVEEAVYRELQNDTGVQPPPWLLNQMRAKEREKLLAIQAEKDRIRKEKTANTWKRDYYGQLAKPVMPRPPQRHLRKHLYDLEKMETLFTKGKADLQEEEEEEEKDPPQEDESTSKEEGPGAEKKNEKSSSELPKESLLASGESRSTALDYSTRNPFSIEEYRMNKQEMRSLTKEDMYRESSRTAIIMDRKCNKRIQENRELREKRAQEYDCLLYQSMMKGVEKRFWESYVTPPRKTRFKE